MKRILDMIASFFAIFTCSNNSPTTALVVINVIDDAEYVSLPHYVEQASLPEIKRTPLVQDMKVGDVFYVTPWSMQADTNKRLWLNINASTRTIPGGTVSMKVSFTENGFIVDITRCVNLDWTPRNLNYNDYVIVTKFTY